MNAAKTVSAAPKERSEQRRNSAAKVVGRPFPPGISGNPGGRPRGIGLLIRAETEDGKEIATFMLKIFRGAIKGATLRDRVAAASWLADRGFGRPAPAPHEDASGVAVPTVPGDSLVIRMRSDSLDNAAPNSSGGAPTATLG